MFNMKKKEPAGLIAVEEDYEESNVYQEESM